MPQSCPPQIRQPDGLGRVADPGGVVTKRSKTKGGVPDPAAQTEEPVSSLSRVAAGVATIRRWNNRLRSGQKPKAAEHKQNRSEYSISIVHNLSFFRVSQKAFREFRSLTGIHHSRTKEKNQERFRKMEKSL